MKPKEGRSRVVIEEVQPTVNDGRYAAKRICGDRVTVTAAIFSDGHDHVAARLLYRHGTSRKWVSAPFKAALNDLWEAEFTPHRIGAWNFKVEAWVDHIDTWVSDLGKRLTAKPDPHQPTQQVGGQDIPLALRVGASHFASAAGRAKGKDAKTLKLASEQLIALAESGEPVYENPISFDIESLAAKYPDLAHATESVREYPLWVDRERAAFSAWYELFPRSYSPAPGDHGTLRDVIAQLPRIAAIGFDTLYMPPIHPIGTQFRKGPNNHVAAQPGDEGSPWAVGSAEGGHTGIHSKLGTFEDFAALNNAAHGHGLELALDIAFQCSPDHPWVTEHPDWFIIRPDGTIQYAENPPKKYQDIYPLNFESKDWRALWQALLEVFQFWIDRGVKVFRVDNPHTKSLIFWEWCVAEIHAKHPDVLFLAEAFTRPHVMYSLAKGGYTQGYTYFTWRSTKDDLESYFKEITKPPVSDFYRPNVWPNTPDILHEQLQDPDPAARSAMYRQRVILASTLAGNYGVYGPTYELQVWQPAPPAAGKKGSEEYLDSEKYQIRHWNMDVPWSLAPLLTTLNGIRRGNPALQRNESLVFHKIDNPHMMVYSKRSGDNVVLVVVNLDPGNAQSGTTDLTMPELGLDWQEPEFLLEDMLTVAPLFRWARQWNYVRLEPSQTAHVFRILPTAR